jgi:hypothetical protein
MKTADTLTKTSEARDQGAPTEVGDPSERSPTACAQGKQHEQPEALLQANVGETAGQSKASEHRRRFLRDEFRDTALTGFAFGGSMTESPISRAARKRISRPWETWE